MTTITIPWADDDFIECDDHVCIYLNKECTRFALVSHEDIHYLSQWVWYLDDANSHHPYAVRKERRGGRRAKVVVIRMHRAVLTRFEEAPSPYHVGDHLNNKTLDNRRSNLQWATISENNHNQTRWKK